MRLQIAALICYITPSVSSQSLCIRKRERWRQEEKGKRSLVTYCIVLSPMQRERGWLVLSSAGCSIIDEATLRAPLLGQRMAQPALTQRFTIECLGCSA
ncbi:hypothetical protein SRHO_G00232510 [Serrasalmus rhombeus]